MSKRPARPFRGSAHQPPDEDQAAARGASTPTSPAAAGGSGSSGGSGASKGPAASGGPKADRLDKADGFDKADGLDKADGSTPPRPPAPAVRLAAGLIVAAGAVVCLVLECFLVPLRIAGVVAPLALLLEVVFHPLLSWLMWRGTGSRVAVLMPVAIWAVLVYFLGKLTPAGDAIIAGDSWVPIGFVLAGACAFLVSIAVLLQRPKPFGHARG